MTRTGIVSTEADQNGTLPVPLTPVPAAQAMAPASIASALMIANLALKSALSFGVIALSVRVLGAETAGAWLILQNVTMYLGLSELGLAQSVANFTGDAFARGDVTQINRTVSSAFSLYWMIVLPVLAVALAANAFLSFGSWLLRKSDPAVVPVFATALTIMIILTCLRVPTTIFPAVLLGLRDVVGRQVFETANALLNFAAIALVLLCGGGLVALSVAMNVSLAAAACAICPIIWKKLPDLRLTSRAIDRPETRRLLTNSSFFFLMGIAALIDRSAGNFLVSRYVSLSAVPSMFALLTIFRVLGWSVVNALSNALQPYVVMFSAQNRRDEVLSIARLSAKASFAAAVALLIVVFAVAPDVVSWITGGGRVGFTPLVFLGLTFAVDSLFQPTNNCLIALNRHHVLAVAATLKAMLTVALGIACARLWADAVTGMTFGFLLASLAAQLVLVPSVTRRVLNLGWKEYLTEFAGRPLLLLLAVCPAMVLLAGGAPMDVRIGAAAAALALMLMMTWYRVLRAPERAYIQAACQTSARRSG